MEVIDLPAIDESRVLVWDDVCNQNTGSILQVSVTGAAPLTYSWHNAATNHVISNKLSLEQIGTGTYYLRIEDKFGNKTESSRFTVNNVNIPPPTPIVRSLPVVKGSVIQLEVTNKRDGLYTLYQTADASIVLDRNNSGKFTLNGITENTTFYVGFNAGNCFSALSNTTVKVLDAAKVISPTAFTPNGDGRNDRFRITAYGLTQVFAFRIFDRWGTEIYAAKNITDGWDGKIKGMEASFGTYVWALEGIDIKGMRVSKQGTVVLIK